MHPGGITGTVSAGTGRPPAPARRHQRAARTPRPPAPARRHQRAARTPRPPAATSEQPAPRARPPTAAHPRPLPLHPELFEVELAFDRP
jgi:hypothetical protein